MEYAELSDEAKAKAREDHRRFESEAWDGTDCYPTIIEVMGYLGFEPDYVSNGKWVEPCFEWRVSYCQGDGFAFDGKWYAEKLNCAPIITGWPKDSTLYRCVAYATALALCLPEGFASISPRSIEGLTGDLEPEYGDPVPFSTQHDKLLKELLDRFNDWAYCYLRDDLEYRLEDEQIVENILANDYDFDENGELL